MREVWNSIHILDPEVGGRETPLRIIRNRHTDALNTNTDSAPGMELCVVFL